MAIANSTKNEEARAVYPSKWRLEAFFTFGDLQFLRKGADFLSIAATLLAMKLHRNLALATVSALGEIFYQNQVAARTLEELFTQNPKWGKRDRAFVAQTTYEIVRWRRLLGFAAQSENGWALLGAQLMRSGADLPDWSEFSDLNGTHIRAVFTKNEGNLTQTEGIFTKNEAVTAEKEVDSTKNEGSVNSTTDEEHQNWKSEKPTISPTAETNLTKNEGDTNKVTNSTKNDVARTQIPRAIQQSIPDWIDELGARELGANWDAEIAALNREALVFLRANTLKISRGELQNQLQTQGIETQIIENLPDTLRLETRRSLASLALYKDGFFEIQDGASQLVAPFLHVESGQKILDACAGAGGKSLHLAALIGNRGHIVACDVEAKKLEELRRRAHRNGVSCLETKSPQALESSGQGFERILIDAPCSGLGTLRRQPDLKWRLSPDFLWKLQLKQREILEFYAPMLQSGGKLVYATCSILPDENERQIEWFLARNSDFELEEQKIISPAKSGFDGFFMARMRRN